MLYFLHNVLHDALVKAGVYGYFRVLRYVTFRTIFAALTAFVIVAYLGPAVIRMLKRNRMQDIDHTTDPAAITARREGRRSIPTMGGVLILLAIFVGVGLWADLGNYYVRLGLFLLVWMGALGSVDDWRKLRRPGSNGLRMRTKLAFQVAAGFLVGLFLWKYLDRVAALPEHTGAVDEARVLSLPFSKHLIPMGLGAFVALAMLVIVASSNAVNLTDGLDGLAIGCVGVAALAFTGLIYVAGHYEFSAYLRVPRVPGVWELTVLGGALVGASLGFLWWNCHPAEVFMGDTGSLALGGAIGYLAVASRNELLLLIVGGVFVIEAGSVLLQVASFKLRHKKRIFLCTPYHHHLQMKGWHDNQITVRFWILAGLFAALGLATLKLR